MNETFFTLLRDAPHWEFELFLIFLFDGVIGLVLWPCAKRFFRHHKSDDQKIEVLEKKLIELEKRMNNVQSKYQ